jgi:amino acid transporter
MQTQRIAAINAILFFFFWLFILLAGADFPPPPGFLWLIIVVAACAFVVYWRVPTYIDWYRTERPGRQWRVVLEGFAAGIVVALPFILLGSGEPLITPQPVDYAIWFAMLGFVGALNSMGIYFINTLAIKTLDPVK